MEMLPSPPPMPSPSPAKLTLETLLDSSEDILLLCTGTILDIFAPMHAAALSHSCNKLHLLLGPRLEQLRLLRERAVKLASDAKGLTAVLTRFEALRWNDEISRSSGFGGYSFTGRDCALVRSLVEHGAFAAPHGVLLNMSLGHIGAAGALALADAIKAGLRLRILLLDDASVTDTGCVAIARALSSSGGGSAQLETISLRRNGIGDAGAAALACLLASLAAAAAATTTTAPPPVVLRQLMLGRNPIGFEGIDALRGAAGTEVGTAPPSLPAFLQVGAAPPSLPAFLGAPPPSLPTFLQELEQLEVELDPPVVHVTRAPSTAKADGASRGGGPSPSKRTAMPKVPRVQGAGCSASPKAPKRGATPGSGPPRPPPPPVDWIRRILAVAVDRDGNMTDGEAAAILGLTDRPPKWLIAQVHPDKHPRRQDEAAAAATRVNQAMDLMQRGRRQ